MTSRLGHEQDDQPPSLYVTLAVAKHPSARKYDKKKI